jgi:hypothetical protein
MRFSRHPRANAGLHLFARQRTRAAGPRVRRVTVGQRTEILRPRPRAPLRMLRHAGVIVGKLAMPGLRLRVNGTDRGARLSWARRDQ